jgi:benzoate membrane transport protein
MSNVSPLGISAPFWALIAGGVVSALVEVGAFGEKKAV